MADNPNQDAWRGVLRQDRVKEGVDSGQDKRIGGDQGRIQRVTKGDYIHYYDDLGFNTTEKQATAMREQEAEFQKNVSGAQGQVDQQSGVLNSQYTEGINKINEAYKELDPDKILSNLWEETKSGFTTINVVKQDGEGGYITEGTYYLPKSVAEGLAAEKGVATNWGEDGQFYVDVKTAEGGKYIGEELHTEFAQGEDTVYQKWYTQAAPKVLESVEESRGVLAGAESTINEQYSTASGQLGTAQTQIDSATYQRQLDWDKLRDDYAERKKTAQTIIMGMKTKEAE